MTENVIKIADALLPIISLAGILATVFINYKERERNHFDRITDIHRNEMEGDITLFKGSMHVFGISEVELNRNNLSIEQLMYFAALLNLLWIKNEQPSKNPFKSRANKRVTKLLKVFNKHGYERALNIAKEMNAKEALINPEGKTGMAIRSENLRKAWPFLQVYWVI